MVGVHDFRFFTPLRCVQNDRGERALCSEWQKGGLLGMAEWGTFGRQDKGAVQDRMGTLRSE